MKFKTNIGIHINEMADRLPNEAAEAHQWDFDLSGDFTEPFEDKYWPQRVTEQRTATGTVTRREYVRDLDNALKEAVHENHRLGMSNQRSVYFQAWTKIQPHRLKKHSDAFWNIPSITASMRRNVLNFRNGQLWNKKLACMRKQAYMPGESMARNSPCPLCRQEDSGGHILGKCLHQDMSKQYIARHDKAIAASFH